MQDIIVDQRACGRDAACDESKNTITGNGNALDHDQTSLGYLAFPTYRQGINQRALFKFPRYIPLDSRKPFQYSYSDLDGSFSCPPFSASFAPCAYRGATTGVRPAWTSLLSA